MLYKKIIACLAIIITTLSLFSCAPPEASPGNGAAIVYPSDMTTTRLTEAAETADAAESTTTDVSSSADDTFTKDTFAEDVPATMSANAETAGTTRSSAVVTTRENKTAPETTVRNSNVVYITPSGKRYHYISTCGGKNSYEVSLDNVGNRTPCQKCAH